MAKITIDIDPEVEEFFNEMKMPENVKKELATNIFNSTILQVKEQFKTLKKQMSQDFTGKGTCEILFFQNKPEKTPKKKKIIFNHVSKLTN